MDAGNFTTLTKDPSLQGELPQWYLCSRRGSRKGFAFAEEEAPAKTPPKLSKALENGRITRERCFRAR